jgi:hypothetical protein
MRGTHVSQVLAQTFHLLGLISLERLKSRLEPDKQSNTYAAYGYVR